MSHTFDAIFADGVLRPLSDVALPENQIVHVIVESVGVPTEQKNGAVDPLAGLAVDMGVADLAENFDDYRLGRRQL